MARLDELIFGYVEITVSDSDAARAADILVREGISASFSSPSVIRVSYRRYTALSSAFAKKIQYTSSEVGGMRGFLQRNKHRWGLICGALTAALLLWISTLFVWDVRVEGCESGYEEEIISALSECGLRVGSVWGRIDRDTVEQRTLSVCDEISWINVNRRGTVAYVSVVDRITHVTEEERSGYASLVASRDCVIEEITVEKGVAAVKAGDTVRAGEVLISGVIPSELGGGFCYAEGSVKGRFFDSVSVFQEESVSEYRVLEEKISTVTLNFFGFSVNIFKNYRNYVGECDIIEKNKDFTLWNGKKIPISLTVRKIFPKECVTVTLTPEKMTELASQKMSEELSSRLSERELIRLQTSGDFADGGYVMRTDFICIGEVSEVKDLTVDLEKK